MKAILFGLVLLIVVGFGGYLFLSKQSATVSTATPNINVSLAGTIISVSGNSEYSFELHGVDRVTSLNSSHLDLISYINKKVTVVGQYSGTTLFVDSVTETP